MNVEGLSWWGRWECVGGGGEGRGVYVNDANGIYFRYYPMCYFVVVVSFVLFVSSLFAVDLIASIIISTGVVIIIYFFFIIFIIYHLL